MGSTTLACGLSELRGRSVCLDQWPGFLRVFRVRFKMDLEPRRLYTEFIERAAPAKGDHHPHRLLI